MLNRRRRWAPLRFWNGAESHKKIQNEAKSSRRFKAFPKSMRRKSTASGGPERFAMDLGWQDYEYQNRENKATLSN
jgi:hypothetical protein